MKRFLATSVCALALLACQDQLPTEPDVPEPSFDINDVHSGGAALNQHFAFRFPMRRLSQQPPAGEAFAGGLQPVMKICRWSGSACNSPESELTLSSGTLIQFEVAGHDVTVRRNGIVVVPDLEAYVALWDSRTLRPTGSDVAENEIYRLRVFLGATELGFVDAKVWRTVGQLLQITRWNEANPTNTYFPLPRNAILPVPFWIGELATPQAQSFALTGLPASVVSGGTASVTVTARDAGGNVSTNYRGTVAFTSSDPDAVLPPNYTFTSADAGAHTFTDAVTFKRAATGTTLRVTDVAETGIFGDAALDVLPGNAASLMLSGLSDPAGAGAAHSITVTARDANGNTATGYTGTISFTSSDPQATLPEDYTFTAEDAGTHAFESGVTLRTAGEVTVRAADNADADIFAEVSVTVGAVAAATLRVTGLDNPTVAGAANSVTVTARDPSGNLAEDYTGTIAFTSTDPLATLPESYTFTAEDAGTHAFPDAVTLRTAGPVTVTATDPAVSTITGAQMVTVTPAAAATLVLAGIPEQSTAGVGYDLSVTARDQFGNTATGYGGTIQFTSTDAAATVPPAYAFQAGDAGVRSFPGGVTFKTAGEQTLQVADAAAPGLTATAPTTVAPAAAAELRFTVQPSGALAGSAIAPPVVVTAYDPFENLATAFTGQVTVAIGTNPGGGILSGTTSVAAVAGAATFADLSISAAGNGYTLTASATGLTGAASEPFNITAPAPVDVHWINPAGGNWSVASNWSTGAVPAADQNVLIDLAGTYTVTLNLNATVRSLTLGAASGVQSLVGATRTLTLTTSGTILSTGRMTLTNCTINGAGTLAIATGGVLTLSQGNTVSTAVDNAGSLLVGLPPFVSNATITGAFTTHPGSVVQIQAAASNSGTLTVAAGFTNHGTIRLTKAGDVFGGSFLIVSSGTLINATDGLIQTLAGSGGGRTLTAQLDNRGTVELAQGLVLNRAGAAHTNSGTIGLTAGNLTLSQSGAASFTNTGTIAVAPASTWAITNGSFSQAAGGTLNGGGALSFNNVTSASFGTTFDLRALTLSSSTASFATDISVGTAGWNLTNSTLNGSIRLTNPAGRTLSLINSTINTAVHNAGTLAAGVPPFANTSTITGAFTTEPGSLVRVQAHTSNTSTLTVANGFTNHGTITLTKSGDAIGGSILAVTTGTLLNAGDGTIISRVETGSAGTRTLAAQLDNQGTVDVLYPLTINRAGADHRNSGTIDVSGGDLTVTQAGTTPSFMNSGTFDVESPRVMRVSAGVVNNESGGLIQGTGTFESGTAAAFNNAGNVTVGLMRVGDGLTSTGTFSPETVEFFGNPATIPVGAGYAYTNVRTIISASFAASVSLAGDLTVAGPGNITIGAHEVTVAGNFATQATSVLTMQNAAGVLTVNGNASFGGATTNGRLTAGTLRVAGNFAQGGTSPAGYAATLNHLTVLNGAGAQSVSFANPGTTTALSHFHRLEIQNPSAAGVTLGSPVFANGQLRTPAGTSVARTLSGAGQTLQVGGLDAGGLVLDGVALRVVNGEPLTRFDAGVFRNLDAAATQFRLDRSADAVTFNNIQFLTPPESGLYLHLADTDAATPLFTVTMQATQPASHGGKVFESVPGQLLGWPAGEGGAGAAP